MEDRIGIDSSGNWDELYAEVESFLAAVKVKNPGKYKDVILVAVSQDTENQIFPIAFAIVEKEDVDNWGWFLSCLRHFVTNRTELCLISDRHTGLLSYIKGDPLWRPPHAYHRYCASHIGANNMRRFNKIVGNQVKVTAMEIQKRKFKAQLEKTKKFGDDEKVYKELTEDLVLKKWSFAHDGGRRYGSETTNISESLNGVLKKARHLPIMGTVMMTFYKSVDYFNDRAVEARKKIETGGNWSTFAIKKYKHWRNKASRHQVIEFDRAAQTYEVQTPMNRTSPYKGNHRHSVDMINRTCSCNKFQQWKMSCSHVLATCMFMNTSPFKYFSDVWSLKSIIQMYGSQPFRPPRDKAYWPESIGPTIIPDRERIRGRGRPQITRFRNEMDWIEHLLVSIVGAVTSGLMACCSKFMLPVPNSYSLLEGNGYCWLCSVALFWVFGSSRFVVVVLTMEGGGAVRLVG
ncbi:uncharacterized protein LOC131332780 [Rhododendron vialii]|uniref:uncharacterized protein LOC131332780 n=1 Tax=Rhododendron vialii TaxID=182163 RepID=UPI00265EE8A1|nr:uncharacterized protein LOC131332780 [Rhododendron vialii]